LQRLRGSTLRSSSFLRRGLLSLPTAGLIGFAGCGDPQYGTIKKPPEAAGGAVDPGRPFGTPAPPPKRKVRSKKQPGDEAIKNPNLRG
jgi:hypothetical protein